MNNHEVKKILKVTNVTLTHYVKSGKLKATMQPNGRYDYDEDSVLKIAGYDVDRKAAVYARVSPFPEEGKLDNQIKVVREYANANGYKVEQVYSDICSSLSMDRESFRQLLEDVMEYKIKAVFVYDKDTISPDSYEIWRSIFAKFCCSLKVVNDNIESIEKDKDLIIDIATTLKDFSKKMSDLENNEFAKQKSKELHEYLGEY